MLLAALKPDPAGVVARFTLFIVLLGISALVFFNSLVPGTPFFVEEELIVGDIPSVDVLWHRLYDLKPDFTLIMTL